MLWGMLSGLIAPALAWLLINVVYKGVVFLNKPAIPYLVALGINLFIIRLCFKKNMDDTGRGIMASTFVCVILILVFKIRLT